MNAIYFLKHQRSVILIVAALALATVIITRGINKGEFNLNTDEAYDGMTGIYVADFLHDMPLAHPVQYTYEYYAQYPALGLIHWPPLFHFAEAMMFLTLGPTVISARLTTLLFAIVGLFFWFKLVRELQNEWTAAVSTVVLACLPAILLYEKAAMLEIPSLALCIVATYFWLHYLIGAHSRSLYAFAVFAGLALLTKQQGVYLFVLCLLTITIGRKWRLLVSWPAVWALGIGLLIAGPFYALDFSIDRQSVAANVLQGVERVSNPFTYYLQALPHQLGWILMGLSIVGMLTCWRWAKRQSILLMFGWIVAWYITYLAIGTKQVRYMVYWLPPFIFFAVAPLTSGIRPKWIRAASLAAALALIGGYAWIGWAYERPYVQGYQAMAQEVLRRADGGVILFDGDLAANYIFFMRALDPSRRFVILRKALFSTRVMAQFGSVELVHSPEELEDLLGRYGIKYVLIEDNAPLNFNSQKILRDMLGSSQFKMVISIPIESNLPNWNVRRLLLYDNLWAKPRSSQMLDLKMLSMSHDIVVPFNDLLRH